MRTDRLTGLVLALALAGTAAAHGAAYAGHQTSSEASNETRHRLDVNALSIDPGDLLVAHLCVDGGGGTTLQCPAGWTEVESSDWTVVTALCVKHADAADAQAPAYLFSSSRAQQSQSGVVVVSDHDPSIPVDTSASYPNYDRSPDSPGVRPEAGSLVLHFMCANGGQVTEGVGYPAETSRPLWLLESEDGTSGPVSSGAAVAPADAVEWTHALATPQDSVGFSLAVRAGMPPLVPKGGTEPVRVDHQTSAETSDTVRHELAADALEVSEGDLLIAHVCADGGRDLGIVCPPGWTRELGEENDGIASALCTRLADAGDANAASFAFQTSRPEQSQSGLVVVGGGDGVALEAASARADQQDRSPVSPPLSEAPSATSVVLRFMCADGGRAFEGEGFPRAMARNLWLLESDDGQSGPVTGGAALDQPGASGSAEWTNALATDLRSVNFTVAARTADGGPVADAGPDLLVTDENGDGAEIVFLDGSASSAPGGALVGWTWSEGTTQLGAGETLLASFPIGSHALSLRVEDDRGRAATDAVVVTVVPAGGQPPDPDPDPDPGDPDSTCRPEAVDPLTLYHIGHSLTDRAADLLSFMLETVSGQSVAYSYKSIPGASLYHHWLAPRDGRKGNIRSGDALQILRSGQFDALVLTETTSLDYFVPHSEKGSVEHANLWVDEFLANTTRPDPKVFIYSTWHGREVGGPDTPESIESFLSEIERRQPLWESIAQGVRDAHPGLPIHIIPGGLVLKELQERVLDGTLVLPGNATFRDTFFKMNRPTRGGCHTRDHIHLSETGIYAIALTHHAVIDRACVEGFPASIPYPGYDDGCVERDSIDVDPALAREIQRVVTEVVNGYAWTGL